MSKNNIFNICLFLWITFIFPAVCNGANKEGRIVRVAIFQNEPIVFQNENGLAKGLFVDLINAIAKKEGWDVEYISNTWGSGFERFRAGEIDLMTSLAYTEERDAYINYSQEVVWTTWGMLFVNPESNIEDISSMEGKTVALMKDSINGLNFLNVCKEFGVTCEVLNLPHYDAVFKAIENGQADAGVCNSVYGPRHSDKYNVKQSSIIFSPVNTFFGGMEGKNEYLIEAVDRYLKAWKLDKHSVYNRSLRRWLISGSEPFIPGWVIIVLSALAIVLLCLFFWTQTLRHMVDSRTKELKASEENYRVLVEGTDNFVTKVDNEGKFIFVNQASERIYGLKPEECIGSSTFDFIHPDDLERTKEAFDKWFCEKTESITFENRQISKSGEVRDMLWNCKQVFSETGEVISIDSISQDITDRKRVESEREGLVKTLKFKNKELQDIVYSASHDLRSPLVNIEGFSNILESDCGDLDDLLAMQLNGDNKREEIETLLQEGIPESLGFITRSTKKMASLLDGLLQVSRAGSIEICSESLDMDKIVSEVVASIEHQIQESKAEVTVESLPGCMCDPNMMDHILTNLVGNAVKYLDPKKEGKIRISGKTEDGRSVYCVEDNGIGIAEGHQGKVFEIFHRLDPESPVSGEGLGLTIVTRIIDRLGGNIWVESEAGEGSKFFFGLPGVQ